MGYFTRRSFVKVGSLSTFGFLGLGDALRMQAQSPAPVRRDISIIHIWLTGGVSQLDTWDPKPDADSRYRSTFDAIETKATGMRICAELPKIAGQADKFVIIRSVTHKQAAHEAAKSMVQSGHNPLPTIQFPAFQTVIGKELGKRGELPPVISVPGATGSWDKAGFLGTQYNPFDVGSPNTENYKVRDLDLPMAVDWSRMDRRQSLLALVDEKFRRLDTSGILDNMDAYYKMAFQLMHSEKAKKAFQIEEEPEALRDKYGRTSLGQGSLLARRLIESGARFVTVSSGNWDHHKDIFPALKNDFLPELDRAFSTLLEDLQQRGLLDTTLVIVSSEFGRTPEINHMAGRDHWPSCFSVVLAGASITGGRVLGGSDEKGMFVKDNPVQVADLIASIYKKLGIDYKKEYMTNIGRPVKLTDDGKPLEFLTV
jgi:hypothetical protein